MKPDRTHPVLILGAGINGAAIARELLLNGISVVVVDSEDITRGATARSSRLIHGGLRYLEYADFRLVKESLHERTRLHRLAPQFVKPLQLHIPATSRMGGFLQSALRFLKLSSLAEKIATSKKRGMWLVRIGLWLYDKMVTDPAFPNSEVTSRQDETVIQVDAAKYRWVCSYWDAQILYPERLVVSMFHDAQQLAKETNATFQLFTYHNIKRNGKQITFTPSNQHSVCVNSVNKTITPALIINACGAWGDVTLDMMQVSRRQLLGGTKGSHALILNEALRNEIGQAGIYAEAADGRPVFVLPFTGRSVLVGTTDIPFEEPPENAIATDDELGYLLGHVQSLFPQVSLSQHDIIMHYSGVRPLPYVPKGKAAAISRGHSVNMTKVDDVTIMTLIGGKLTTCRAFAEDVVKQLAKRWNLTDVVTSQNRTFPGADNYPKSEEEKQTEWQQLVQTYHIEMDSIAAMWELCGTDVRRFLEENKTALDTFLTGTALPRSFVCWLIEEDWVTTLDDLVERRLMLLFSEQLSQQTLFELADCLIDAKLLTTENVPKVVQETIKHLSTMYGKSVSL